MKTRTVSLMVLTLAVAASASPAAVAGAQAPIEAGTPVDCVIPGMDDACERWAHRYTEGEGDAPFGRHNSNRAEAGALSPSGNRAFIVGSRVDLAERRICPGNPPTICQEMQTVAYDTATGSVLWVNHELPPWEDGNSVPRTILVSSDEETVYVIATVFTGSGSANDTKRDVQLIAYDAATGDRLWGTTYDGPAEMQDDAFAAAVSPVDNRLFVAAASTSSEHPVSTNGYSPLYMTRGTMAAGLEVDTDFALLTFDGTTGELTDEVRRGGATFLVDGEMQASWDVPTDIEVSPDGERVVIAGLSDGRETHKDGRPHATVTAWDATDGGVDDWELAWAEEVPGIPLGLGLFPAEGTVAFAGAYGQGGTEFNPYAVIGLDADTGMQRWETRYALGGINSQTEYPRRLLADPARGLVHLPGISRYSSSSRGTMGVLALRADDGGIAWRTRLRDPRSNATIIFNYDADEMPVGALDPASGHVQVTSVREGNLATFSLDGATGAQRWAGLFEDPVRPGSTLEQSGSDWPVDMEAAGGTTVVFGNSYIPYRDSCPSPTTGLPLPCSRDDFLSVAYEV